MVYQGGMQKVMKTGFAMDVAREWCGVVEWLKHCTLSRLGYFMSMNENEFVRKKYEDKL